MRFHYPDWFIEILILANYYNFYIIAPYDPLYAVNNQGQLVTAHLMSILAALVGLSATH